GSGERGDLRTDLRCGPSEVGVFLNGPATLNLNGFSIAGAGTSSINGVQCSSRGRSRCTINGPGEIRGFQGGIACGLGRLEMPDVVLRGKPTGVSRQGVSM